MRAEEVRAGDVWHIYQNGPGRPRCDADEERQVLDVWREEWEAGPRVRILLDNGLMPLVCGPRTWVLVHRGGDAS
jgi:hypothetical protein